MEINRKKLLKGDQYYPVMKKKNQIFLHHTAGTTADGAIDWWNQTPEHVGTAYVIDRDGTIYEVFDPEKWAYHIGVKGDNNHVEKHAIGIEIVAAGQLYKRKDNKVFFYPLYPNLIAKTLIDPKDVWEMKKEWRGYSLYHKYNQKQILSVCWLVAELIEKFNIPIQEDISKFYEYDKSGKVLRGEGGIYSHSTVRKDKTDIVPHPEFIKTFTGMLVNLKKRDTEKPLKKKRSKK